jgi:hypothetical protein
VDAYLVPVLAAFAGAFVTAAVLGAVRLGRWWRAGRRPAPAPARGAQLAWDLEPDLATDASDPHLSRLAHHSLGAALVIALTAFFFFAAAPGAGGIGLPATVALLAAWAVGRTPR